VLGAVVGSGSGGGTADVRAGIARPSRGGLGPPRSDQRLVAWDKPVPILMYHVIANAPATAQLPELFVDPKTFTAQMKWLRKNGYAAVSLNQVYDSWFKDGKLPDKPVVLTFDDGYRGDFAYARRTLHRLRWPGDLNMLVGNLGEELTEQMVDRLIDDGWELDAHTISHLDLTTLSGARLRQEVAGSRRILQQRFHQPVNFFCYPAGKFDAATIQAVRQAGYLGATTELPGEASRARMFELHRIRVDGSDGVSGLAAKLRQQPEA
jgi:peptidoglycan/xylan/chitin deacetylase (PgdA/CDA1 family)